MKNLLFLILLWLVHVTVSYAQEMGNKDKMKIFTHWIGRWQGEGSMQMGPGEPKKSTVDEHVEFKLDGMILQVEGVGKAKDASGQEAVVHHALGIISYDQSSDQYKFKTYLKDGRGADAWLKPTGTNTFQWGFDIPSRGKTRYSITIDPVKKTWHEIGEFSADGNAWSKFFEMNLIKKE